MGEVLGNIIPLFGLVLIGYLGGRRSWLSQEQVKGLSTFVFYLAIPALLFRSLGRGDVLQALDLHILAVYFAGIFLVMVVAWVTGWLVFGNSAQELPVMALGATYSNIVLLGIPLIYALYGEAGLLPIMMIVSLHSLVLLPLTMVLIEVGRGADGGIGQVLAPTFKAVAKNPVILSIVAGITFSLSGLTLPGPVDRFASLLGGASAPCALFALGATLSVYRLGGDLRESATIVAFKLLLLPVFVWVLATQLFQLPSLWVAVATVTAALPTGVNVFIIADQYKVYLARTTATVLISTGISLATVTALVVWFGQVD
jgi:malonate transporter and related proteins